MRQIRDLKTAQMLIMIVSVATTTRAYLRIYVVWKSSGCKSKLPRNLKKQCFSIVMSLSKIESIVVSKQSQKTNLTSLNQAR